MRFNSREVFNSVLLALHPGNNSGIGGTGPGDVSRKRAQPLGPHRQRYTAQHGCESRSAYPGCPPLDGVPGGLIYC